MFLVLYITFAAILHAHPTAILVVHTILTVLCIVALAPLEENAAAVAVSGSVVAVTAVLLYATFYYFGYARCQAYLMRVQAVQTKSGAAASGINNSFIRQVLHDFGTPISTLTLGIGEFSTNRLTPLQKATLEEIRLACWHLNALRDRAMQFAVDPLNLALPRMRLMEIDIKDYVYHILRPLIQGETPRRPGVPYTLLIGGSGAASVRETVPARTPGYRPEARSAELGADGAGLAPRHPVEPAGQRVPLHSGGGCNTAGVARCGEGAGDLQGTSLRSWLVACAYKSPTTAHLYCLAATSQVMDTGPGVPEEERQYIFHPFSQGRAGQLSRQGNGTSMSGSIGVLER
jgi:signal transduction histidine kinase